MKTRVLMFELVILLSLLLLAGCAEDVGQVLSLSETVTVPYGSFDDCLQTAEWNLLEPGIVEHKFYAPGVGLLRAVAVEGESGYEDLIDIVTG